MKKTLQLLNDFVMDDTGQDFAEYALILGAIAVVAIAVIANYRNQLTSAFNKAIEALQLASGG
jgi:Flp pilus assembly pilin Flp